MNQPVSSPPPPSASMLPGGRVPIGPAQAAWLLQRRIRAGANAYYYIAVLSLVNTLVYAFGGGVTFAIGLEFSQLLDGFAVGLGQALPNLAVLATVLDIVFSIAIAGIVALFGYFGGRGQRWPFLVGMTLYGLDAVLALVLGDWLTFAFHLFFLWVLFAGFRALNQLQKSMPQPASDFPQDIGVH